MPPKNGTDPQTFFNHDQAFRKKLAKTPCTLHEKSRKHASRPGQASRGALTDFSQDSPKQTPKNVPRIPLRPHQGICNPCPQTLVKTSLAYHITFFRITQGSRPSMPPGPQDSGMPLHARGNTFSRHGRGTRLPLSTECRQDPPLQNITGDSRDIPGNYFPGNYRGNARKSPPTYFPGHPKNFRGPSREILGISQKEHR